MTNPKPYMDPMPISDSCGEVASTWRSKTIPDDKAPGLFTVQGNMCLQVWRGSGSRV